MSSGVQLSGNEMLNKKVLSSRRKVRNDEAVRRETGRVFHARAAATCVQMYRGRPMKDHVVQKCPFGLEVKCGFQSASVPLCGGPDRNPDM